MGRIPWLEGHSYCLGGGPKMVSGTLLSFFQQPEVGETSAIIGERAPPVAPLAHAPGTRTGTGTGTGTETLTSIGTEVIFVDRLLNWTNCSG